MADKGRQDSGPKRLNRFAGVGEALSKTLDPVFRKRGFAGRDIVTRWSSIAPSPYDRVTAPDRLVWPRGDRGAGGATLYLRCSAGHALALSHEAPRIAEAINRYFGYVLVNAIRLSAEPFESRENPAAATPSATDEAPEVDRAVATVADEGLRRALGRLGRGVARTSGQLRITGR